MKYKNNFTTPEQSKRLLELGVPADSADCYHVTKNNYTAILHNELFTKCRDNMIKVSKTTYRVEMQNNDVLPCWSVGQLMKIVFISMGKKGDMLPRLHFEYDPTKEINIIEDLVDLIEYPEYKLDFSKLED